MCALREHLVYKEVLILIWGLQPHTLLLFSGGRGPSNGYAYR